MLTWWQEFKIITFLHFKSISNLKLRPTYSLTMVKSRDASASKNTIWSSTGDRADFWGAPWRKYKETVFFVWPKSEKRVNIFLPYQPPWCWTCLWNFFFSEIYSFPGGFFCEMQPGSLSSGWISLSQPAGLILLLRFDKIFGKKSTTWGHTQSLNIIPAPDLLLSVSVWSQWYCQPWQFFPKSSLLRKFSNRRDWRLYWASKGPFFRCLKCKGPNTSGKRNDNIIYRVIFFFTGTP